MLSSHLIQKHRKEALLPPSSKHKHSGFKPIIYHYRNQCWGVLSSITWVLLNERDSTAQFQRVIISNSFLTLAVSAARRCWCCHSIQKLLHSASKPIHHTKALRLGVETAYEWTDNNVVNRENYSHPVEQVFFYSAPRSQLIASPQCLNRSPGAQQRVHRKAKKLVLKRFFFFYVHSIIIIFLFHLVGWNIFKLVTWVIIQFIKNNLYLNIHL